MSRLFIAVPVALMMGGCATVYVDMRNMDNTVAMTDSLGKPYKILKHFRHEQKAYFLLLGFIKVSNPDFTNVLRTEIKEAQGDAVINTSLEIEYDLVDTIVPYGMGAVGWAVLGPVGLNLSYLITMQTYRIKGDVVRYSR